MLLLYPVELQARSSEQGMVSRPLGPLRSTGERLLVADQAPDVALPEPRAAVQEAQFDQEGEARHRGTQPGCELSHGCRGAARGDHVVHDQRPLTRRQGVLVDLEAVAAVLELVARPPR